MITLTYTARIPDVNIDALDDFGPHNCNNKAINISIDVTNIIDFVESQPLLQKCIYKTIMVVINIIPYIIEVISNRSKLVDLYNWKQSVSSRTPIVTRVIPLLTHDLDQECAKSISKICCKRINKNPPIRAIKIKLFSFINLLNMMNTIVVRINKINFTIQKLWNADTLNNEIKVWRLNTIIVAEQIP